jgi:hypothetical protein
MLKWIAAELLPVAVLLFGGIWAYNEWSYRNKLEHYGPRLASCPSEEKVNTPEQAVTHLQRHLLTDAYPRRLVHPVFSMPADENLRVRGGRLYYFSYRQHAWSLEITPRDADIPLLVGVVSSCGVVVELESLS